MGHKRSSLVGHVEGWVGLGLVLSNNFTRVKLTYLIINLPAQTAKAENEGGGKGTLFNLLRMYKSHSFSRITVSLAKRGLAFSLGSF
jgi:hypothetical protein